MLSIFDRMGKGILAVMGQDSFLRSTVACRVNIEHGVEVVGFDENSVVLKAVATIDSDLDPKVGDLLVHPDGTYKLDVLLKDCGINKRFILIKSP